MIAVAKAYKERSLQGFQDALAAYRAQLVEDPIVHAHLSQLYDTLLEGNLARLIEPFSCVEISHLAELIKLPQELVLNKLSQVCPRAPRRPHLAVLPEAESCCCTHMQAAAVGLLALRHFAHAWSNVHLERAVVVTVATLAQTDSHRQMVTYK